jgi:hypothetical protein
MKIFIVLGIFALVNCDVEIKENWREVKFPWDTKHYREVMRKILPITPRMIVNRNGRIAGKKIK